MQTVVLHISSTEMHKLNYCISIFLSEFNFCFLSLKVCSPSPSHSSIIDLRTLQINEPQFQTSDFQWGTFGVFGCHGWGQGGTSSGWRPQMLFNILQYAAQPHHRESSGPNVSNAETMKPLLQERVLEPVIEGEMMRQLEQTLQHVREILSCIYLFIFSQSNARQPLYSNMLWHAIKATFLDSGNSNPRYSEAQTTCHFYSSLLPEHFGATEEQEAYAVCFSFIYAEIV